MDLGGARALVLAAGKSTRIHAVSKGRPKPLLDIDGDFILARNLRWLARQGLRDVFVNLHYKPDEIREAVGDGSRYGLNVTWSLEEEILGTAGAAKHLEQAFRSRFFVIYGDNLLSTDLSALMAAHVAHGAEATILLFDRERHPHTGIAGGRVRVDGDDRVLEFVEGASDAVSPLVNAGVYVLEPSVLELIPPSAFYDFGSQVFPDMLKAGRAVYGHAVSGYCLGIDTPETFDRAMALIRAGEVELQ